MRQTRQANWSNVVDLAWGGIVVALLVSMFSFIVNIGWDIRELSHKIDAADGKFIMERERADAALQAQRELFLQQINHFRMENREILDKLQDVDERSRRNEIRFELLEESRDGDD